MPIPRAYRNDRNAPWNDPPAPECPDCLTVIHEIDDHKEWCEFQDGPERIREHNAIDKRNMEEY